MKPKSSAAIKADVRASLKFHFGGLRDPRDPEKIDYPLTTILTIVLLAVMCGLEGWDEFAVWAAHRREWLATFLDGLDETAPCESTLRRVFTRLNPKAFHAAFQAWAKALAGAAEGRHVAVDGKALRGAFRAAAKKSNLYLVSAFATDNKLVLAQVRTDDKSNEMTAIPALLALLDLKGAVVTIDAAGTQTPIAEQIVTGKGDYILALKGNQGTTHDQVGQYLTEAQSLGFAGVPHRQDVTEDAGHGRTERRVVVAVPANDVLPSVERWAGLQSFVLVERTRCVGDGPATCERWFYLTSLPYTKVKAIAGYIRGHWAIENNLHWCLDVQFGEDASKVHQGAAPENLGLLRRFVLNCFVLRTDVKKKTSLRRKALLCMLDDTFMIETLLRGIQ